MTRTASFLTISLAAALLLFSGCDSGDPVDRPDPGDVAGFYEFTQFVFEPDAPAVQPINVLDTLDAERTDLRLSSDGTFILSFQFVNGSPFFLNGSFVVSNVGVELDGRDSQSDTYARILLSPSFTLRRDPNLADVLTAEIAGRVNAGAFSRRYSGLESLPGRLRLRLER